MLPSLRWRGISLSALPRVLTVLGFPFAYGIFQDYYSTHPPFAGERNIAVIGTCAMGLMYLSAPLVFGFLQRYPRTKRPSIMVGLLTMCLALGLSSLSNTVAHLIVTQGIFYAIGGALAYSPAIQFMDEWFVKRKGLAFGVMWVRNAARPSLLNCTQPWNWSVLTLCLGWHRSWWCPHPSASPIPSQ